MATASDQTGPSEAPLHLPAIPADIYCTRCAYNLFGCTSDRCPECGRSLANLRSPESRIPWVHRHRIGRLRAYWRTVWMVTFRTREFLDEYARPLSLADAHRFHWLTVLHVVAQAVLAAGALYLIIPLDLAFPDWLRALLREVWPVVIAIACLVLFVVAVSHAHCHFFHPSGIAVERQNSAMAMSLYDCGTLAFLPTLLTILFGGLLFLTRISWPTEHMLVSLLAALGIVIATWWTSLFLLARKTMPQFPRRRMLMVVILPLLWSLLAGVLLLLLPAAIFYVLIVVNSLR